MRFKELRGLLFGLILATIDIWLIVHFVIDGNQTKLILAILLSGIVLVNILTQYFVRLLDDCIVLYRFVGIFFLPTIIDFKEIDQVELIGKCHLLIQSKKGKNHIYVRKASKLYEALLKGVSHEKN